MPGEAIIFSVLINNLSTRQIETMVVHLVERIVFRATKLITRQIVRTTRTRDLATQQYSGPIILGKCQQNWENVPIIVPPGCLSSNGACTIIDIKYYLDLHVLSSGYGDIPVLSIPVVIGTIPMIGLVGGVSGVPVGGGLVLSNNFPVPQQPTLPTPLPTFNLNQKNPNNNMYVSSNNDDDDMPPSYVESRAQTH